MSRTFKKVDYDQALDLRVRLGDCLPPEHLARFVVDSVAQLDLAALYAKYGSRGGEPYAPEMLLGLLLYGYATGIFSSRKIERATYESVAFRFIAYTIITTYQLEYRGVVEYYRLAYNLHTLQRLKWIMETALTKTLAAKHKISVRKVYQKYRTTLEVNGKTYKGLQVKVPREGKEPLVATWGGIPLTWDIKASIVDRPPQQRNWRSELEKRLLTQVCEICETTHINSPIEVHHIRALKDLKKYEGREKPLWVKIMAARKRKTLVLCRNCHDDLHAGRPLKKKVSRSRT